MVINFLKKKTKENKGTLKSTAHQPLSVQEYCHKYFEFAGHRRILKDTLLSITTKHDVRTQLQWRAVGGVV